MKNNYPTNELFKSWKSIQVNFLELLNSIHKKNLFVSLRPELFLFLPR